MFEKRPSERKVSDGLFDAVVYTHSKSKLLIRQLNIEHFQIPANKPLACCPLPRVCSQLLVIILNKKKSRCKRKVLTQP